jgi:hypothetical protein
MPDEYVFHNDDLSGFFTSVPQQRLAQAVHLALHHLLLVLLVIQSSRSLQLG